MILKNMSANEILALGALVIVASLSQSVAAGSTTSGQLVKPDPDYREKLASSRISTYGWKTDFSRHSVPFGEVLSGGVPRDGIPPIDKPEFVTVADADGWLAKQEPVIALEINGDARAYPLQVMIWHELVNDEVGGMPVTVSFCPLCNSVLIFDRKLDGVVYDFGVSGNLRNSDLIMWDRQTESWWQQLTGNAIIGQLAGKKLRILPSSIIAWSDFKAAHPQGKVLSKKTGYLRRYGDNPYVGYDRADTPPFLFDGKLDDRLQPKERVLAVTIGEVSAAFPFGVLRSERVVSYTLNGQEMVILFKPGARSALGAQSIADAADVGATGVFDPNLDGEKLRFRVEGEHFVDRETGSVWNILGEAIDGPLAGKKLTPIVHANHFWFTWAAFKPDTTIYGSESQRARAD
ncbi:MAG: DUF3179 domain-containing protein [Acidiferrobacterales bacterium]